MPKRKFLQLIDIETNIDNINVSLSYDEEWLTILNLTNHLINAKNTVSYMPGLGSPYRWNFTPTDIERQEMRKKITDLLIPQNFSKTAEIYNEHQSEIMQPKIHLNPQTKIFCENLQIDDPLSLAIILSGRNALNQIDNIPDISVSTSQLDEEHNSIISNCINNEKFSESLLVLPSPRTATVIFNPEELDVDESKEEVILSNDSLVNTTSSTTDKVAIVERLSNGSNTTSNICDKLMNNSTLDLQSQNACAKKFKKRNIKMYMPDSD